MVDKVSYRGGYLWSYLSDFSRRWGEMEAYETMIWVQPPGTATVGHVLLDAFHATSDEMYYVAAAKAADALVWGQYPSGGWNYMIDFAGEASLLKWYETIGKNGWRLEEFHYYYGNATFDDVGTAESSRFLLRLYLERRDPKYKPAVDKALRFIVESQYENGCFPQRYPMTERHTSEGQPRYPAYYTFNDDVLAENIDVLLSYYLAFGDKKLIAAIRSAMDCVADLQLPQPQPGWSLQYSLDGQPAAARSHEPVSLSTKVTARNISLLLNFYQLTGDAKYLGRVPEAIDWLSSVRLPESWVRGDRAYPALVSLGENAPLFVHRRGSNVVNGEYFVDSNPEKTIIHSSQIRAIDVDALRNRYLELRALPVEQLTRKSPLLTDPKQGGRTLPLYYSGHRRQVSDMSSAAELEASPEATLVASLIGNLNQQGYWPTPLERISNPYIGSGPRAIAPGDFAETEVGDRYDTSPYVPDDPPVGISTAAFVRNMSVLVNYLARMSEAPANQSELSRAR